MAYKKGLGEKGCKGVEPQNTPKGGAVTDQTSLVPKENTQIGIYPEIQSVDSQTLLIMQGLRVTAQSLANQSSEQNAQLISLLQKSQNEIALLRERLVASQEKQSELLAQVSDLTQQLVNSANLKTEEERRKEEVRQKKRVRKRKPLKDPLDLSDLRKILELIKEIYQDPIISSRYQISVCLLYVFGIRVNELRQIKVGHLKLFMEGHPLHLQIGKTKVRTKFSFPSSKGTRDFLNNHVSHAIKFILENHSHNESIVPISREHLTRELNSLISNYGNTVNKTLLSHSCRVSFITRVCKTAGIEAARAMVGHAHISTTQIYNRNYLSQRNQLKIFNDSLKESSTAGNDPALNDLLSEDL